ncbi:MAG: hypothetical protein JSV91_13185 [Phycisphaerales bacterium]|nr:MAG: hypothetical protein JSV91_13185 [Phycisphaerales bacterium]
MKQIRPRACRPGAAAALITACIFAASPALADSIEIVGDGSNSTEGLGSFSGLLSYEADPFATIGLLTVELTNTTAPDVGGYITGFLFNIASTDADASATLLGDPPPTHPFEQCTGNGLNGEPYGNPFDSGAALGGEFLGGGDPTGGIAVGETGVFAFEVQADDAADLTALNFLEGGPYDFNFLVRFRGFANEGSDKVPAVVVPLPAPMLMGGAGLLGVFVAARRRRGLLKTTG